MSEPAHFLGYESVSLDEALFSVIPAPNEETATYVGGQAKAPRAILDASSQIEDYDEETGLTLVDEGIHCLRPEDAPEGAEEMKSWFQEQVTAALDATAVPIILGGEGTATLWGVEAILPKVDELSILQIDAHADFGSEEDEESHHTVTRRLLGLSPAPHVCQVGVRSLSREAFDRIVSDDAPIECFFMSDLNRAEDESWHEDVIRELRSPVYVNLDLTAFDPSVFPGVSNPEPGGFFWWEVLRLLKKVAARRRIAALDIVELCPREGDINSDYGAARLAYKAMNYIFHGGKMLEKPRAEAEEHAEAEEETAEA
jgi:agmatinase